MHPVSPPDRRWPLAACALALLLLSTGCGKTGTVEGEVTFDGQPMKSGKITFIGPDNHEATGTIADGKYSVSKVPLGECKVKITSLMPPGGTPAGPGGIPGAGVPGGPGPGVDPRVMAEMQKRHGKEHPEAFEQNKEI